MRRRNGHDSEDSYQPSAVSFWLWVIEMLAPTTPIEAVPLAVVDVETTGLDPRAGDRVCEIAVLRVDPGERPRLWVSLVNPERPIGAGARAVNGIADKDVADAPPFSTLIDRINAALDGAALVAHNVPFDLGFLRAEYRRAGTRFPTMPALDTLALARGCFRFPRNDLGTVARSLGVPAPGLHRAEGDVWATYYVLQRMIDELRERGCQTLGDFLAAHRSLPLDRAIEASDLPEPLATAVRDGRSIAMRYAGPRGTSERVISPLLVDGRYVVAYCHLRNDERTFRLDRIVATWWPDQR